MASLTILPRARIFHGHDWVYASEVRNTSGDPKPGDVVTLKDLKQKPIGSAIYNPKSQIVARRISHRDMPLDQLMITKRIERAWTYRQSLGIDTTVCRVVWSESDGLPGLIVDRYGDHLVYQTLTLAFGLREDMIITALKEIFNPVSITARNDANVRLAEGMEVGKKTVFGTTPPPFFIKVAGLTLKVDVMEGQKTGLYIDQIDNYLAVANMAKGRRVLDCFSNQGGFAQACALAGAEEVTALDVSGPALRLAEANAQQAGVKIHTIETNAFDWLKKNEAAGEKYDLIVLDPPSFTRTKASVNDALRGYKEIHLRAIKMLAPGGRLATFSCSHHVSLGEFYKSALDAMVDAKKTLRLMARFEQRRDHPIIAGLSETEYLRGYAFELLASW
jgi:23S rRNA (cytosine1962-C5)-methyltransferase